LFLGNAFVVVVLLFDVKTVPVRERYSREYELGMKRTMDTEGVLWLENWFDVLKAIIARIYRL
jgi:hypothetical protein